MIRSLAQIYTLLLSFAILCLGHGLQSVLIPARATLENYSELTLGLLTSSYFIGFITGTFTGPHLIARVGYIHVFAASAAGACAVILCFPLAPHPLLWIMLRFAYGLCLVHFYTVMESWLNSISGTQDRGKILSAYMIINFIAMSCGQLMFSSTQTGGFQMFSICGLLISLSLIPLLLSRIQRPEHVQSPEAFGVKKLYEISPLGMAGALVAGLTGGAYWGLTAPYLLELGFPQNHLAWFMAISLLGGLISQWPLGMLSDRIDRRWVVLLATSLVCTAASLITVMGTAPQFAIQWGTAGLLACAFLFGAGFHPLYSLFIAHTNDFVPPGQFVRASATLQLVQSSGAVIGPVLVGLLMQQWGSVMLYGYIATLTGLLFFYTLSRLMEKRIPQYMAPFQLLTRTGSTALLMDPRSKG